MKIKKTFLTFFILFFPFFLIVIFIFFINIIIKDLNYSHKSHNTYVPVVNWTKYYFELKKKKIENYFLNLNNNFKRLNAVNIYVTEKSSRMLLSNIPSSTKKYVDASIDINGKNQKVMLRYLGDNPRNYMFHKKSIRLKLKKSELANRTRYLQFKNYEENILERYTSYLIAKNLNMLVPKMEMVELFVNGENSGLYLQSERLNESFLRRNKIMPINIYKGEAYMNSEKKIGLEFYLDQNPGLWDKISYYNMVKKDDYSDLINFFHDIKKANGSIDHLNKIIKNENLELLARASIFELLTNSQNGDYIHNRRIALDPWSGNTHILPHDYAYNKKSIDFSNNYLDQNDTNLFNTLNQSSKFLNYKYNLLIKLIKEEKIFKKVISDLLNLKDEYINSKLRDLGLVNPLKLSIKKNRQQIEKEFNDMIVSLKEREQKLISFFEQAAKVTWENSSKGFDIFLEDSLPLSNLQIRFKEVKPKWVIFDYNNNKIIDKKDLYFYPDNQNQFKINLKLFANRIAIYEDTLDVKKKIITQKTKFSFFVDNNYIPTELLSSYNLKKKIKLNDKNSVSTWPSLNNIAINNNHEKQKILSGKIFIDKDFIIKDPIRIKEGTIFTLKKNVSIIFENKVEAIGSHEKPIIFKSNSDKDYFGTVAIHGLKTEGSIFKNVLIQNGSGNRINGINYFSSLSINSTKNIRLKNIEVRNNSKYDDMVHIIYSKDVKVENSKFINAFRDSIDVDISENIYFNQVEITNSGNDGIDFMESTATLKNLTVILSGDKGISVGENSDILVDRSIFRNNYHGLASKDLSRAKISNSLFENNDIQLSVYKKNWRYGASGNIFVYKSKIISKKNNINSDNSGLIKIVSSDINGEIVKKNNVIIE